MQFFGVHNNEVTEMKTSWMVVVGVLSLVLVAPFVGEAQTSGAAKSFVHVANSYRLAPNITYMRASGVDLKLDVYQSRDAEGPNPTLVYFHGGGWTNGSKESSALTFLPYLKMGWNVVNVGYRLADVAHAPAAVEDCRCALRWIYRNAEQFNFDLNQIVVTGNSAGGHLSLTTGMLPESADMDRQCPGNRRRAWSTGETSTEELKVAAIINWYGITDVVDSLHRKPGPSGAYTVAWLGSSSDREDIAQKVSPLTYVRRGLPPTLTIHGDADPIVPYEHAVRLHEALDDVGVPNELVTVPGGGHGGFTIEENLRIYAAIRSFLSTHGLPTPATNE